MMPKTLGIDFGTSNTAAALAVSGKPWLVPVEPGKETLPTSVFFDLAARRTVYGSTANTALIGGREGRYMRALKSVLGTSLMRETRLIAHERLSLLAVVARFLAEVRKRAQDATGLDLPHALSGRPVHFHSTDTARDAQAEIDLREAYLMAGFADVSFMYEPEAAALASGALQPGATGLIVDIGGGTSDFSVFRREGEETQFLATHGVRLGGTDFDRAISLSQVMPILGRGLPIRDAIGAGTSLPPNALYNDLASWEKIPFLYTPETRRMTALFAKQGLDPAPFAYLHEVLEMELGHDLAFAVETGKIAANNGANTQIDLSIIAPSLVADLGAAKMADILADYGTGLHHAAHETLRMAGLAPHQIDTVVYVGGSSLMHVVTETMAALFPGAKQERTDPFNAVASGLALAAAAKDCA